MTASRRLTALQMFRQLNARLDQQAAEISILKVQADSQFDRIACLQIALDVRPAGQGERRTTPRTPRTRMQSPVSMDNAGTSQGS